MPSICASMIVFAGLPPADADVFASIVREVILDGIAMLFSKYVPGLRMRVSPVLTLWVIL